MDVEIEGAAAELGHLIDKGQRLKAGGLGSD